MSRTFSTGMAAMVVQLGLATMPLTASSIACGLTSLTTRGTSGSMRQALELSMTSAPASAKRGAWAREPVAPAEKSATSTPAGSAVATSSTTTEWPPKSIEVPAERAVANRRSSRMGNERSARISSMTVPTWPVAPTTAREIPESEMRVMRGTSGSGDGCRDGGVRVRVARAVGWVRRERSELPRIRRESAARWRNRVGVARLSRRTSGVSCGAAGREPGQRPVPAWTVASASPSRP